MPVTCACQRAAEWAVIYTVGAPRVILTGAGTFPTCWFSSAIRSLNTILITKNLCFGL